MLKLGASRGIKQGCLVAPLVWSLVTGRFLYLLAARDRPSLGGSGRNCLRR